MAYPTEVNAVQTAPTTGALGSTTPTHSVLHDQYRSALLSLKDKIDPAVFYVDGLVENDDTAAAANTALIQAALDAARAWGVVRGPMHPYLTAANEGWGTVKTPPGLYYIDRSVLSGLTTKCLWLGNVKLQGHSMGTRLRIKSGTGTNASPCGGIGIRDNTSYVGIEDITIDGAHGAGETVTDTSNLSHGIDLVRSGVADLYDGAFWMKNVMIFGWQGHGLKADGGTTTLRAWDIYSYHNKADGFRLKTDQALWGCKAGNNTADGFVVDSGTDVQLVGCKAFGGTRGFVIGYSESILLSNCQAEDFQGLCGIYLSVIRGCQVNGVVYRCQSSDSLSTPLWVEDAGTAQTNPYSGDRPFSNVIDVVFRNVTPDNVTYFAPKYGLVTRNIGGGTQIRLTMEPGVWATGRHNSLGTSYNGQISWNSSAQDSVVTPAAFATPYTPDADLAEVNVMPALTANLTINAPANPWRGQRLHFFFTQDATGTRTVTFNSVFKKAGAAFTASTGNGAKCSISFLYDGTAWMETDRALATA